MKHKLTEVRLFLLQATLAVIVVLLFVFLMMKITGRLPPMNASGIYSPAPTYGILRLPSGAEFTRDMFKSAAPAKTKKVPLVRRAKAKK
ncbi:hypothetical protein A3D88_00695 [Candidatus Peribacteria bacterium RIFCSPHIGHO2_02_FULL_52_16]|nr:MAG: hypothetical protein A2706_00765 [Candidatus Peribacteria bacterium RIFCSPHIGHO2_01_FULL_51_35]OGJ61189.1 MAG: hypothetical protein A3D88_00695 [Candidatus Peribacteria bacterium RIFCSPHIGHO2_02_FULL_52_16]